MNKRRKVMLLSLLILMPLFTLTVSANSPPGGYPPGTLTPFDVIVCIILAVPGLMLTLFLERLTAKMLPGHKQYLPLITKTNIISQILMHYLYLRTYSILYPYQIYGIVVLEIMVYLGEFLVYKKKMKDVPTIKILQYTMLANTASLLAGGAMILLALWYIGR